MISEPASTQETPPSTQHSSTHIAATMTVAAKVSWLVSRLFGVPRRGSEKSKTRDNSLAAKAKIMEWIVRRVGRSDIGSSERNIGGGTLARLSRKSIVDVS